MRYGFPILMLDFLYIRAGGGLNVDLREIRLRKLLSQRDLARQSGVSETTIVKLEQGATRPHPSTLRKVAAALGIAPEEMAELASSQAGKASA
jgi:transcriptional regulator with XRE-family HTH domain